MPDHRSSHSKQWAEMGCLSERVIEAVAAYSNTQPLELPPLYNTIDPDALDALFQSDGMTGRVEFQYNNYNIVASKDGDIDLSPLNK